jgi:hypothetical protein
MTLALVAAVLPRALAADGDGFSLDGEAFGPSGGPPGTETGTDESQAGLGPHAEAAPDAGGGIGDASAVITGGTPQVPDGGPHAEAHAGPPAPAAEGAPEGSRAAAAPGDADGTDGPPAAGQDRPGPATQDQQRDVAGCVGGDCSKVTLPPGVPTMAATGGAQGGGSEGGGGGAQGGGSDPTPGIYELNFRALDLYTRIMFARSGAEQDEPESWNAELESISQELRRLESQVVAGTQAQIDLERVKAEVRRVSDQLQGPAAEDLAMSGVEPLPPMIPGRELAQVEPTASGHAGFAGGRPEVHGTPGFGGSTPAVAGPDPYDGFQPGEVSIRPIPPSRKTLVHEVIQGMSTARAAAAAVDTGKVAAAAVLLAIGSLLRFNPLTYATAVFGAAMQSDLLENPTGKVPGPTQG